ncbi:hypothetical protein FRC07_004012 [Ceratobasidium sp. 392]|nr:hypothetical protein FRC07_004012 [Ceratobasidium sp. 392]
MVDKTMVKAANKCIQNYIHSPLPSTMYPTILRQISGEAMATATAIGDGFDSNSLGSAVDELATTPHHNVVAALAEQPSSSFTQFPIADEFGMTKLPRLPVHMQDEANAETELSIQYNMI